MSLIRVLLAGESWISNSTHYKGFDFFSSTMYEIGVKDLQKALDGAGIYFTHLPAHLAAEDFPSSLQAMAEYDVILLSDVGANTLLLHPDTWVRGLPSPNRLELLKAWVEQGGGLGMCGGYLSFAGMYASAKYYRTPIEAVLPVNLYTFDDRIETPQGVCPEVVDPAHPILSGITGDWPVLLGYNELVLKPGAKLLARTGEYPLLAVQEVGKGRTLAWASDIGPHWCPETFMAWPGYARMWVQAVTWLANK